MQVPSSNPTEYCRLCFSQHRLQNVLEGFDPSKMLLSQMGNLLGLWLAPGQDFPCVVCRLCASALDTFEAFRERTAECDHAIKQVRKIGETFPLESIKVELLEDEDHADNGSDRDEGALVIDEPSEPMNESEAETNCPEEQVVAEASPIVPTGSVWSPVKNTSPKHSAQFVCMECENTFNSQQTLEIHQREIHGDPEASLVPRKKSRKGKTRHYSCGQCSAIFYGYGAALTHLAQAHKKTDDPQAEIITGDVEPEPEASIVPEPPRSPAPTPKLKLSPKKNLECKQCRKKFTYVRSLDTHMRTTCKVRRLDQPPEPLVSISPKELRQHLSETAERAIQLERIRKTGPGISTGSCFRCGICNEVIKGSKAFLTHRRNVHGWKPPNEQQAQVGGNSKAGKES